MAGNRNSFLGRWRIVASELWVRKDLDTVVPALITFSGERLGELELIVIGASIDYRVEKREGAPMAEFTWEGSERASRSPDGAGLG